MTTTDKFGRGIICPFQRDGKGDFANASGKTVLGSDITELLGIIGPDRGSPGELPWDMDRGSRLMNLKHRKIYDEMTTAMARQYTGECLRKYEDRVIPGPVSTEPGDGETSLKVLVSIVIPGWAASQQDRVDLKLSI